MFRCPRRLRFAPLMGPTCPVFALELPVRATGWASAKCRLRTTADAGLRPTLRTFHTIDGVVFWMPVASGRLLTLTTAIPDRQPKKPRHLTGVVSSLACRPRLPCSLISARAPPLSDLPQRVEALAV
jgi:hypothetical protein